MADRFYNVRSLHDCRAVQDYTTLSEACDGIEADFGVPCFITIEDGESPPAPASLALIASETYDEENLPALLREPPHNVVNGAGGVTLLDDALLALHAMVDLDFSPHPADPGVTWHESRRACAVCTARIDARNVLIRAMYAGKLEGDDGRAPCRFCGETVDNPTGEDGTCEPCAVKLSTGEMLHPGEVLSVAGYQVSSAVERMASARQTYQGG